MNWREELARAEEDEGAEFDEAAGQTPAEYLECFLVKLKEELQLGDELQMATHVSLCVDFADVAAQAHGGLGCQPPPGAVLTTTYLAETAQEHTVIAKGVRRTHKGGAREARDGSD